MKHLILLPGLVLVLILLLLALPTPATEADKGFAFVGVKLFDGAEFTAETDVLVLDGRIESVGRNLDLPDDIKIIDGHGHTLLPGLIDGHTHSFGNARRDAARFGVTTLLDMFTMASELPAARAEREDRNTDGRADLYSAGTLATAREGHGTQYGLPVPTVDHPDEAETWVRERLNEGSDYIKIVIEPGRAWSRPMPTLDEPRVRALVEAAHRHERLALAHVSTQDDALMAIRAGADGLVHLFADQPASEAFVALAAEHDVFVIPTTVVLAGISNQLDNASLAAEPGIAERLSAEQRQTLHQSGWGHMAGEAFLARAIANVTALHGAGVALIAGSDAPNPGTAHGLSLHRELEFLVAAGLSPTQALQAATSIPAKRFGLEARGCIAPGCRADLLLVSGDPETDIRATRRIETVWKDGVAVRLEAARTAAGQQARLSTDLLDESEIGHWQTSDDRFTGGQSEAELIASDNGSIQVQVRLRPNEFLSYAGLMWAAGDALMQPVDLSNRSRLRLRLRGEEGPWTVMLFSGEAGGRPEQFAMMETDGGAGLEIALDELVTLDRESFQAIGVFAVGQPRQTRFELIEARLE